MRQKPNKFRVFARAVARSSVANPTALMHPNHDQHQATIADEFVSALRAGLMPKKRAVSGRST